MSQKKPHEQPSAPFPLRLTRWLQKRPLVTGLLLVGIGLLIFIPPGGKQRRGIHQVELDSGHSPASWMQRFHESGSGLDQLTLNEICLPGTHDSGAYQVLGTMAQLASRWLVTQKLDLREQLEAGARKLDLRIMKIPESDKKFDPGFYIHHSGFPTVSLDEGLEQIGTYLQSEAARSETVLLEFSHFKDFDGNDDTNELIDVVVSALGAQLYPKKDGGPALNDLPLRELKGKALFLLAADKLTAAPKSAAVHAIGKGGLAFFDQYSNRDIAEEMIADQGKKFSTFTTLDPMFQLCWTLTHQKSRRFGAGVERLAGRANAKLMESFESQDLPFGRPNAAGRIVNIINVDFFGVGECRALETCESINSGQLSREN